MSDVAVSILIVSWNTCALLQQCLASLPNDEVPFEVVVVDNASTDGSVDMVRTKYPRVHLVSNKENLGFAVANNLAAREARGKYLLLLNPDTIVPRGALIALLEAAETHPRGGAFGPQLQNQDGSRQRSCWHGDPDLKMALTDALYLWRVPWLGSRFGSEYRTEELLTTRKVDHLLGACMLIRHATWAQLRGFDERYFLFLEETDWCTRARTAGWDIYFVPQAQVTHFGQVSMRLAPTRNLPQFYRSYMKFYRAHHGSSFGQVALTGIFALGCALRIGMWWWREKRAREDSAKEMAARMRAGYRQTLRELNSF